LDPGFCSQAIKHHGRFTPRFFRFAIRKKDISIEIETVWYFEDVFKPCFMKRLLFTLPVLVIFKLASFAQEMSFPPPADNQKAIVTQYAGLVKMSVTYSRPNVTGPNGEDRKGKIWGQLLPYGENVPFPWRAGANEKTLVEFSHDVIIEDKILKPGKYGFGIYLEKDGPWTIIFSNDYLGWGMYDYKKEKDALRIKVNPTACEHTEYLTFSFDNTTMDKADLVLRWESVELRFPVRVPDWKQLYVENFRAALEDSPTLFYSQNWEWAADFCAENNVNLEEALTWVNYGMAPGIGAPTFSALNTKAKILTKLNRQQEADKVMDQAIKSTTATVNNVIGYGRRLLAANSPDRALSVFKIAESNFPENRYATALALADYYAQVKDKKSEVKYVQLAIKNIPERQKGELPKLEARLK
jgi:hypothetical protein